MPKVPISTRVEDAIAKRLDRVALVDRRKIANLVEICIEEYLPTLEAELAAKQVKRTTPAPAAHAMALNEGEKYPSRSKLPPGKRAIAKDREN